MVTGGECLVNLNNLHSKCIAKAIVLTRIHTHIQEYSRSEAIAAFARTSKAHGWSGDSPNNWRNQYQAMLGQGSAGASTSASTQQPHQHLVQLQSQLQLQPHPQPQPTQLTFNFTNVQVQTCSAGTVFNTARFFCKPPLFCQHSWFLQATRQIQPNYVALHLQVA